jgi:hypothetical protein
VDTFLEFIQFSLREGYIKQIYRIDWLINWLVFNTNFSSISATPWRMLNIQLYNRF